MSDNTPGNVAAQADEALSWQVRLLNLVFGVLAWLPLWVWRGLGWLLGKLAWQLVSSRRKVALVNLRLCFPDKTEAERERIARLHFVRFMQTFLDRIWLWHGSPALLRRRLHMVGDVAALHDGQSTILFAPHFVGLDAGGMALSGQLPERIFISIYTPQSNRTVDAWVRRGRTRFPNAQVVWRRDGVKPIIAKLRKQGLLYLLPDMNFGPQESIFVSFFGVPAATVPSLSRFARLGRAQVVSTITYLEPHGYTMHVEGPWQDFPTDDVVADTQRMNDHLEAWVARRPEEYYWVHKRFKTRPEGLPEVY